ncbi:hypothetical protein ScPMuIL_011214 [Solemya velum]
MYIKNLHSRFVEMLGPESANPESVTAMLADVILSLCKTSYASCSSLDIDGIICISDLNAKENHVIKIHDNILHEREGYSQKREVSNSKECGKDPKSLGKSVGACWYNSNNQMNQNKQDGNLGDREKSLSTSPVFTRVKPVYHCNSEREHLSSCSCSIPNEDEFHIKTEHERSSTESHCAEEPYDICRDVDSDDGDTHNNFSCDLKVETDEGSENHHDDKNLREGSPSEPPFIIHKLRKVFKLKNSQSTDNCELSNCSSSGNQVYMNCSESDQTDTVRHTTNNGINMNVIEDYSEHQSTSKGNPHTTLAAKSVMSELLENCEQGNTDVGVRLQNIRPPTDYSKNRKEFMNVSNLLEEEIENAFANEQFQTRSVDTITSMISSDQNFQAGQQYSNHRPDSCIELLTNKMQSDGIQTASIVSTSDHKPLTHSSTRIEEVDSYHGVHLEDENIPNVVGITPQYLRPTPDVNTLNRYGRFLHVSNEYPHKSKGAHHQQSDERGNSQQLELSSCLQTYTVRDSEAHVDSSLTEHSTSTVPVTGFDFEQKRNFDVRDEVISHVCNGKNTVLHDKNVMATNCEDETQEGISIQKEQNSAQEYMDFGKFLDKIVDDSFPNNQRGNINQVEKGCIVPSTFVIDLCDDDDDDDDDDDNDDNDDDKEEEGYYEERDDNSDDDWKEEDENDTRSSSSSNSNAKIISTDDTQHLPCTESRNHSATTGLSTAAIAEDQRKPTKTVSKSLQDDIGMTDEKNVILATSDSTNTFWVNQQSENSSKELDSRSPVEHMPQLLKHLKNKRPADISNTTKMTLLERLPFASFSDIFQNTLHPSLCATDTNSNTTLSKILFSSDDNVEKCRKKSKSVRHFYPYEKKRYTLREKKRQDYTYGEDLNETC